MTEKQKAWKACSRYCRLRDALAYCKLMRIDLSQFNRVEDYPVKCCTCQTVKSWIYMDSGHFIGRGFGGSSGVYFDERNINTQCKRDNAFKQGRPEVYYEFMLAKFGQEIIDELKVLDKLTKKDNYIIIGQAYKEMYEELLKHGRVM